MDHVPHRVARWWRRLDDHGRRHASVLALLGLGYVVHYLVYCLPQPFFIEDAAITFSYARNLVEGEGLVTYPGGERVEGYSNALWTFLMAGLYALGVPIWTGAKVMGAVFGVATLPLAYGLVKQARPGKSDDIALLAPLLLAASPQFAIWNAAGLENSLFCVLLAAGSWRLLVELQRAGAEEAAEPPAPAPWSAGLFFLLSMTRPEAVAYAVFALFALVLDAAARRKPGHLLRWLPAFLLPFALYQAWRIWYFAWEFPNTYYAKLALKKTQFQPFNWASKKGGWGYVRKWFVDHHVIWALPVFALASAGFSGWRKWVGVGVTAWLAVVLGWDGREGLDRLPDWWRPVAREWVEVRVWSLAGALSLGGLLTLGRPGWRARGLLWLSASFAVFFAVYSKGDWMKAHRWFNLASVPLFAVLTIGAGELLDALRLESARLKAPESWRGRVPDGWLRGWPARGVLIATLAIAWTASEIVHINRFANGPETSTRDIHRRVRYMTWVQRQLDVDHVTLLDVDMGAHMYFSGWDIVNIAGLVDVPIARHRDFNMDFMREYVFAERDPEFAHVHGGWASASKIPRHKEWKQRYLELPGYPIGGRKLHVGNHIRKDLFVTQLDGTTPDDAIRFEGGVRLLHSRLPSPEVPAGGLLFLDTAWQSGFRRSGFRVLAILDDGQGHRASQALAPGYDWYPPSKWKAREVVHGRFRVPVPDGLPPGDYALTLVLLDEDGGHVLRPLGDMGSYRAGFRDGDERLDDDGPAPEAAERPSAAAKASRDDDADRVADDSLPVAWDPGLTVHIVAAAEAYAAAEADQALALQRAADGDCDGAWAQHKDATRHVLRDEAWQEPPRRAAKTAVAECLVRQADQATDRADRIDRLVEARQWDRHLPALLERARPLAEDRDQEGDDALSQERWEEAYEAFADAVALDPRRSWSRRKAEDARDLKLNITRPGRASRDGDAKDKERRFPKPKPRKGPPKKPRPDGEPTDGEPPDGEPPDGEPPDGEPGDSEPDDAPPDAEPDDVPADAEPDDPA